MIYKFLCTLLLACCLLLQTEQGFASGITNYPTLITPEYWLKQNPEGAKLLLDAEGIKSFNSKLRTISRTVYDMSNYPSTLSGDAVKTQLMNYAVLEDDLYLNGNKVSDNYKDILRQQTNIKAVPTKVNVRYALTVRRTPIRNMPTGQGLYYYAADHEFDALQESCLDPGEPVAVLHQSANGYFYYIQSYNYSGWVYKFNLAFTDKKTWLQFVTPKNFLVVTDAQYKLKVGKEQVLYQQGARLPIVAEQTGLYVIDACMRKADGNLQKQRLNVPKTTQAVHKGYLPYTSHNIVRSAFKFHGMPYGWGGLKDSVDCSSLVLNAYRTVGIYLPRNSDDQANTAGVRYLLEDLDNKQKLAVIRDLTPGAALCLDGHDMLYIGKINGSPYAIHSLGSHFVDGFREREMKVVVSDLTLKRSNGNSFLEELTTAVEYF